MQTIREKIAQLHTSKIQTLATIECLFFGYHRKNSFCQGRKENMHKMQKQVLTTTGLNK